MIIAKNKKVFFEYEIIQKLTAGIQLLGSEVKSIRNGDVNIKEAFCLVIDNEMFIRGMHIAEYKQSGIYQNHEPKRQRKLLLRRKEIDKLKEQASHKGLTIKPLSVLLTDRGLIKVEIGLCRGKKLYNKKQAIRERDVDRDVQRELKGKIL